MSGFLNHLVAKGRGSTLPRLKPRRPAPYEDLPTGPAPDSLELLPQTSSPVTPPLAVDTATPLSSARSTFATDLSISTTPSPMTPPSRQEPVSAAAMPVEKALPPSSSAVIAPAVVAPTTLPSSTRAISPPPAAVTPTRPLTAPRVNRRMAGATPNTPPAQTPVLPQSTQTPAPPLTKAKPAVSGATEQTRPARAHSSGASALPNTETHLSVTDVPQIPVITNTKERASPTPTPISEKAPPPLLELEAQSPWPQTQAPASTPNVAKPTTETAAVEVHIGTIEIVATPPPAPIPIHHDAPSRSISLDDFLDGAKRK